ncbi:MAG: Hpt domain-containing protein, partial [Gammaproteobacteria bacterium]|nr:Hpt domain-containing protein [Gammaproteobacteria bacterium]
QSEAENDVDSSLDIVSIIPVADDLPILKPDSDPEILEIYLEEAEEESENIIQLQQDWKLHPEDDNALQNIRRAFHTIKGSGRLVGAMRIGEFAWDFEHLLNRIIDKAVMPSESVINAVGMAAVALPQLVEELRDGSAVSEDIPYIRGLARALAEFKPNQVLEIRSNTPAETQAVETSDDDAIAGEVSQDSASEQYSASATEAGVSVDQGLAELTAQEETPPDPFVLSEMVDMPGREVDPLLPATQAISPLENSQPGLIIDPELLVIYQQEVESHLNTANSVLNQPPVDGLVYPSEELYRATHTINGASRTADITSIGTLATLLEKPLKIYLERGAGLDEEALKLYRKGFQAIHLMTNDLVETRQLPRLSEMLKQDLEELMLQLHNHTVELPEQENQPSNQFLDTLTMMTETVESDYDEELVDIFIEEAIELLEMSDHTLQNWAEHDDAQDDAVSYGLVMELQRYLHTLKGGAKMAEFTEISDLSHELESLFIAVIDGRVEKSDDLIDALHDSFDLLNSQIVQARNHRELDSSSYQVVILRQLRTGKIESETVDTQQSGSASNHVEVAAIEKDAIQNRAPEFEQEQDAAEQDRRLVDRDVVKVRADLLDNLVNSAGEVSIYRTRMEQQVSSFGVNLSELGQTISRLKNQLRALEAETDAQIHFSHKEDASAVQNFDPLEMDRYTQIQQLSKSLSESVDDLSSLQSILGDQVKDSETLLLQQSRINTDLQDGLIRSRMVRFSGLTSRLRRLVRKTSSELAKKAELVIEGEHNEIDIKVLDRMLAPIEHIVRNAISHGLESPIERVKKGKPETGVITIQVSRDGSDVVLKISDDGAGVNVRKVQARATSLGLLGEHEEMDENDVIQFILEPGFSTAEQVTQVSGRGVGMDVVSSSIKQLGGTLQISTSPQGTVFTARLPFTLSINQAILVQAGDESYALPLINIEGITRIEAEQMHELYQLDKPSLDYAGQQYGLYYLSSLLDIAQAYEMVDEVQKVPVILLRSGDLRVALHIDVLLGNREIVVKPLGKLLSQVHGISGASILADGLVVLILDINGLIRYGINSSKHSDEFSPVVDVIEAKPLKDVKKVVMVVDDSITMRRVASKLLSRNNFAVVTAKDGVDALAQLEESAPDIMLLDIEMPRMDGFELALHMKNEARFRDIPIIMITSRTGTKHRDHAMKIGVNKYMGKPYQEDELIGNITELMQ